MLKYIFELCTPYYRFIHYFGIFDITMASRQPLSILAAVAEEDVHSLRELLAEAVENCSAEILFNDVRTFGGEIPFGCKIPFYTQRLKQKTPKLCDFCWQLARKPTCLTTTRSMQ